MRIAHVITRMIIGGAQENTLLCCRELVRAWGDQVLLITGPALGPEGDLLECEAPSDVAVKIVPELQRPLHPWRDARCYAALKRVLRDFQPEVVHTHSAKGGWLGRLAATAVGVPAIVHTVHGAPFHPYQGRGARILFRCCERYAARKCHAIVSVADAMTELLVRHRVAPREKFTTIYSGMEVEPYLNADTRRDQMRQLLGYTPRHVVVGKIARLFKLKGHQYLIEAARRAAREWPEIRFLLVGDGLLRERCERQIARLGLTDCFQFTGLTPPDRIPDLIGAMDMLVHASLREGLARALPQALIAGKPVISYDVDGAREVVLPRRTGILLPPRSVAPLADAILELAADPQLRQRLGQGGRQLCAERFRHQKMTAQIRLLYQQLLRRQ